MAYNVTKLPDLPVVVIYFPPDFDMRKEGDIALKEALDLLEAQPIPVFLIADMQMPPPNLDDLAYAANLSTRQMKLFRHLKVRENIFVSGSPLIALAAKGANTPIFGNVQVKVVATMQAALDYVGEQAGTT